MSVDFTWSIDFDERDDPSEEFIQAIREKYPTEREVDKTLTRKMRRRGSGPYRRPDLTVITGQLQQYLEHELQGVRFAVRDPFWFTGGVSKIQIGFTLDREVPGEGERSDRLVIRMDPSEGSNATSRAREHELLKLVEGLIPVPKTYFCDAEGEWFPEPALIYAFVEGVTKPRATQTGKISGLGTQFGPDYRARLAPQYLQHLAALHNMELEGREFQALEVPSTGTTQAAGWAVNHALRTWEEDRGEDSPLVEVAGSWLAANLPVLDKVSVVHGDYRSGNFLFDDATAEIRGWLDWERGLLGDRHRDLAWITLPTMGHYDADHRYWVCGLIPIDEFVEEYTRVSGLSVDPARLRFYQVLNCYMIMVSTMASNYRIARLGRSHQDILLTRVEGLAPVISRQLIELLSLDEKRS